MTGSNNPLVPGGALSDSYIDPASTALVAPEISAPVFDASQPSARYVSPKDMAGNALLNLAGRAASGFYEGVVKPVGQVFTGELTPSMGNEVKPEMRPYPAAETQGIQYHYNPDTNMFHPATPVDYDPFDVTTPGGDK